MTRDEYLKELGFWAEKFGIPAVTFYAEMDDWGYDHVLDGDCDYGHKAREAIEKLSKGLEHQVQDTQTLRISTIQDHINTFMAALKRSQEETPRINLKDPEVKKND